VNCSAARLYTSPETSSLMGKSRLMKEIARHCPTIYICLRSKRKDWEYPNRSPSIADFLLGGFKGCLPRNSSIIEQDDLLSTLKFSAFFEATPEELTIWISNKFIAKAIGKSDEQDFKYEWLGEFFAESRRENYYKSSGIP
jgi:hypothetical protein